MNDTTIEVLKETITHIEKANKKWGEAYDILRSELRTTVEALASTREELQATKKELAERTAAHNALVALIDKYLGADKEKGVGA